MFDPVACRSAIGDAQARAVEAKARADAEAGAFDPPRCGGGTFQQQIGPSAAYVVYGAAYNKRLARIERKKQ
jgi:hypothetical protein